jgi:hypothetical protein
METRKIEQVEHFGVTRAPKKRPPLQHFEFPSPFRILRAKLAVALLRRKLTFTQIAVNKCLASVLEDSFGILGFVTYRREAKKRQSGSPATQELSPRLR